MIRVTVELISANGRERDRVLGVLEIVNDGTSKARDIGNYRGTLVAEYTRGRPGVVEGFRRQRQSVWTLVGAFLKQWGHTKQGTAGDMPGTAQQEDLL